MKILYFAAVLSLMPVAASASEDTGGETPELAAWSTGESLSSADALAKAGELDRAIAILERFLAQNPANTEGQLLYARTLSWKGEYEKAIVVYGEVIQREPQNAEALAGYARVLSWKGEYERSVEAYRRSLDVNPESVETRTGLARTLWWKGEADDALKELSIILSKEPGNAEALALEKGLRQDKGPHAKAVYLNASDSDRNRIKSYQASFVDTFGLPGHRFEFGYKRFETSLPGRSATASFLDLKDSIKVMGRAVVTPRISLVSLDSSTNDTVYLTEGLSFNMPLAKGTAMTAAYSRYPLVDTARLIENNIRVREAALALTHEARGATLSASALSASYSDGNSRYDLTGGIAVNLFKVPRVIAGIVSEYRDFSERTANGYFNPPNIFSNSVYADASGRVWQKFIYRAKAAVGTQSYQGKTEYATSFQAGLEWEASRDLSLEAGYKYSRSALESASGFRFEEFRAGVNYLF
ncbi:MAG: tetratricopeptide repeat protein [Deltaproteobacteria bacterium]|nr:tetratricopeptide repeat protein [Deltaproteobacteria bacterium]